MENRQHWQDWLNGIVGIWLIISPWVLRFGATTGPESAMTWNFVISGAIALILAIAALTAYRMWEEWVEVVLGLWLIVSPWVLNFSTSRPALWSAIISGAVIVISAGWNLIEERQQAGHA